MFRGSNEAGEWEGLRWFGEEEMRKNGGRRGEKEPVLCKEELGWTSAWLCLHLTSAVYPSFSPNSMCSDFLGEGLSGLCACVWEELSDSASATGCGSAHLWCQHLDRLLCLYVLREGAYVSVCIVAGNQSDYWSMLDTGKTRDLCHGYNCPNSAAQRL